MAVVLHLENKFNYPCLVTIWLTSPVIILIKTFAINMFPVILSSPGLLSPVTSPARVNLDENRNSHNENRKVISEQFPL